jgi:hypothetical protein
MNSNIKRDDGIKFQINNLAFQEAAQQSVHRTSGTLRFLDLVQAKVWFRFVSWFSPLAGNAGRWAASKQ